MDTKQPNKGCGPTALSALGAVGLTLLMGFIGIVLVIVACDPLKPIEVDKLVEVPVTREVPVTQVVQVIVEVTATPDINATIAASTAATIAAMPTDTPIPTPTVVPTPTPIPSYEQWLAQELEGRYCQNPENELRVHDERKSWPYEAEFRCHVVQPTPTPSPTPRPTYEQWLAQEMAGRYCEHEGNVLYARREKKTWPYDADFVCSRPPTPTPYPTPTRYPTPTPRPTPTRYPTPTPAPIYQDQYERVIASITVRIDNPDGSSGSGFFAPIHDDGDPGDWYVYTNHHVVYGHSRVNVYWHPARKSLPARVLRSDEYLDVAILDLAHSDFFAGVSYAAAERINDAIGDWQQIEGFGWGNYDRGDEIWIAGYPRGKGHNGGASPLVEHGSLYDARLVQYQGLTSVLEHSVRTEPGSSGSPVMNRDREIFAIVHGGNVTAERIGLAVPLWKVFEWLGWD